MPLWSSRSSVSKATFESRPVEGIQTRESNATNCRSQEELRINQPFTSSPTLAQPAPQKRLVAHARSISHPFPSLFSAGKRVGKKHEGHLDEEEFEGFTADAEGSTSMNLPRSTVHKSQSQPSDGTFVTGNCATCDCTVRWPQQLDVYRCTVCLMVNDLKPFAKPETSSTAESSTGVQQSRLYEGSKQSSHVQRKASLSVDRTRALVEQSILGFLRWRVQLAKNDSEYQKKEIPSWEGPGSGSAAKENGDTCQKQSTDIPLQPSRPNDVIRSFSNLSTSAPPRLILEPTGPSTGPSRKLGPPTRSPPLPPTQSSRSNVPNSLETSEDSQLDPRRIFRSLENYLLSCLNDCDCLNAAFNLARPHQTRTSSEASIYPGRLRKQSEPDVMDNPLFEVDAKTLLLGDIGENGTWWTGGRRASERKQDKDADGGLLKDRKALRLDWPSALHWYDIVLTCGRSWRLQRQSLTPDDRMALSKSSEERAIDEAMGEARYHVQRTFLKAIENLLRRPARPLKSIEDCRFLLILLSNPLLYPTISHPEISSARPTAVSRHPQPSSHIPESGRSHGEMRRQTTVSRGGATGQHSGIVKRILGLLANLPYECHQAIVSWLCKLPERQFREIVELVSGFVSYRLSRQSNRKRSDSHDMTAGLIPQISGPGAGTSAQLHAALDGSRQTTTSIGTENTMTYSNDWQIRVAAKVMSLLFSANDSGKHHHHEVTKPGGNSPSLTNLAARQRAHRHSQILPTSAFYNTMLDYLDLTTEFENWEARRGKFSFCQYPMFLSIWAKIRIMEHDAHRQMEIRARDAFFTSIMSRKAISQFLVLKVRRNCLVDDSLRGVSEVVGTGQEEIKKGLRIEFLGEEGVDAGGLRKEWFLLLVREVFDPDHGLFVYDEESHYCYFNPNSFETSDQFFLVGVVLGLAIYNSTILDVALPPFAFRKLLASAPSYTGPTTTAIRPSSTLTLEDLSELKPSLARGLRQLLEEEGNVEAIYCRDFVADVERYGKVSQIPLCSNGEKRPVTNSNRREFVELYVKYMLETSVARQYEPFKRGFFTVCGGNALSLFRPEEIELLVRGSDEPLDVSSLRAVAVHENWPRLHNIVASDPGRTDSTEPQVVEWFWELLASSSVKSQRKILAFITGSDRIPAMGATSLVIKIVCLTDDYRRYPVARTCFNMLGLHQYRSKEELHSKLWRAVTDSEGFGLK